MDVNGKIEQFDRVRREFSQARGWKIFEGRALQRIIARIISESWGPSGKVFRMFFRSSSQIARRNRYPATELGSSSNSSHFGGITQYFLRS